MTNKKAQELLIQNGQLVADTLRHLADNEIDSDYFAITSTNENGTETECELVITEYARHAAGTVDELVKALEALEELVELQRFKLERQAEDLHQAKSLESIHREKRYEAEREFSSYKERAESNTRRLAQEVCRLEDELQAAEKRLSEITAPNMLLPAIDNLDENQLRHVIKTCTENYSLLHRKWEAAEKRIADLERGSKVIKCWSCQKSVTVDQVKAEDGYCPLCDCGIDLEEYETEELAAAGILIRINGEG